MKILLVICGLCLLAAAGCGTRSGGSGPPAFDQRVKLALNAETPVADTGLKLTLKEVAAGPAATVNAKLKTMEVQRVLKPGEFLELGDYKVSLVSAEPGDKPSGEVQVLRQ